MKKLIIVTLLIMLGASMFLCQGCCNETESDNISPPLTSTVDESLYWMEVQGRFYTKDLARAQAEIPFPILLPTYIPDQRQDALLPDIDGPLHISSNDDKIKVNIKYLLDLGGEVQGDIFITECNHHYSLGDPKVNPELELIEINGKQVVKTRDDFASGAIAYFSFNHNNIYFVLEMHNLSTEETVRIVESIIKQME